ncbi:MAG: hypothetical protein RRY95_05180 [Oscillospiraceae bacterium]
MWLSKQLTANRQEEQAGADLGVTTIGGGSVGALTRGELRELPVFSPGGILWQPQTGETVLVIRGGTGGEEQCIAGVEQKKALAGLKPGELYLFSTGGASIYLRRDGRVEIDGDLLINGIPFKACSKPVEGGGAGGA